MPQRQSTRAVWEGALREAEAHGLDRGGIPARAHAWTTAVLHQSGGIPEPGRPDITSGFRSRSEQRELIRRWEPGDRCGLRA